MQTLTISANIDIRAPRDQVWSLVADFEKRVRLCPWWDVVRVEALTPGPLSVGSAFRLHTRRQQQLVARASRVVEFVPGRRITHARDTGASHTTWSVQDCAVGTRLLYQETFELNDDQDRETITQAAQRAVNEWLSAIKLYLEWRAERLTRAWRWLYDRAFLRMPTSQRRIVMTIFVMHLVSAISFIAAALVWGVALHR